MAAVHPWPVSFTKHLRSSAADCFSRTMTFVTALSLLEPRTGTDGRRRRTAKQFAHRHELVTLLAQAQHDTRQGFGRFPAAAVHVHDHDRAVPGPTRDVFDQSLGGNAPVRIAGGEIVLDRDHAGLRAETGRARI